MLSYEYLSYLPTGKRSRSAACTANLDETDGVATSVLPGVTGPGMATVGKGRPYADRLSIGDTTRKLRGLIHPSLGCFQGPVFLL